MTDHEKAIADRDTPAGQNPEAGPSPRPDTPVAPIPAGPSFSKTLIFVLEISLIAVLAVLWFTIESFRTSKNLWILFFYSFPAEFLISVVPHEPMLLYFGKYYPPLTVALVAVSSTVMTEALNYSMFKFVTDLKAFERIHRSRFLQRIIDLFNRAPFLAIMIAGFTPVPFYPFRFMVVMARYPLWKYLGATFLSRTPRFIILAQVGRTIKIPDVWLAVIFLAMLAVIYAPIARRVWHKKRRPRDPA